MSQEKILIVEDETIIRASLKRLLERNGYIVNEAGSIHEAQASFCFDDYSIIISDLRLPGAPGTDLIQIAGNTPVLIMTSYASLNSAVSIMKQGAVDYIAKPFEHNEMVLRVAEILNKNVLSKSITSNHSTEKKKTGIHSFSGIIGQSPIMLQLFKRIQKVSPTDATVLIQGESGVGKELVAQAIHKNSNRATGPMISVNCAAIPESLIESELFGHEKGSFTGAATARTGLIEAAHSGTLFLDEIGELPIEAQARLLRVLQESEIRRVGSIHSKKVNVRIIAATHRNLLKLSTEKKFREDLYYRLKVVELHIPPLRKRGKDVVILANNLLKKSYENMKLNAFSFSPEAITTINTHQWPGNVRELENAIERAVILSEDHIITPENMDIDNSFIMDHVNIENQELQNGITLENYFQRFVLEHQEEMTETELAQKLGISRKTLWERRQRLGIPRKKK